MMENPIVIKKDFMILKRPFKSGLFLVFKG